MKNVRQRGLQPKCSSSNVFIPSCKIRNLVAELCQMTNLRCRLILFEQTLVSQQVPCLWVTENGEMGQQNFHAVTWSLIFHNAEPATVQGNHQCQSKVLFHTVGQEKKGGASTESKNPCSNQKCGPIFSVVDKTQTLCLAWFYTGGRPPRDQVRASFFLFSF